MNKMKELRLEHGYSQIEFAELLEVSRSCVQKWENGSIPNKKNSRDIKKLFPTKAEVDELLRDDSVIE